MRTLLHTLLLTAALLLAGLAQAETVLIVWDAPTTRMDGSALAETEIAGYDMLLDGELVSVIDTQYTAELAHGKHTVQLRTVDTTGLLSDYTDLYTFPVSSRPNAPGNVRVKFVTPGG